MVVELFEMNEEGQSIMEFLLMLPLLISLSAILVRINSAIQVSIVDQQYARAQALFLTYNSPFYPKVDKQKSLVEKGFNQMVIGVSDNIPDASGGEYTPKATVQLIARRKNIQSDNTPQFEPPTRAMVRIRNTVTLCTPTYFMKSGGANVAVLPLGGDPPVVIGQSLLSENTQFTDICRSPVKYEQ